MEASLTIPGITKVVPLSSSSRECSPISHPVSPRGRLFTGTATTKRADFGMTRDNVMELGVPPAPGADVEIELDIEANANSPRK